MLQYLKIENLALLDSVTLEFEPGFTAVTGETGAGKSVLLGALSLLSGGRTDKTLVRQGAEVLEVEAALWFADPSAVDARLEAEGLPVCEDGVLLLQRSIPRSKMPKVRINGRMATLGQLQELGDVWIDFHGPGEPQKLFQERRQLEMLDAYAGSGESLADYARGYREWRSLCDEVESLRNTERLAPEEIEFVRGEIGKIDRVGVDAESIEALERDYSRVAGAQELVRLAAECAEGLTGDAGVASDLSAIVGRLQSLAELDPDSGSLLERARSLLIELQDLGDEVARLGDDFDFDPETVESVTERMNLWQEVRRRHGGSVDAVRAKREELERKLASQGDVEGALERKRAEAEALAAELREKADRLTERRREAAGGLAARAGRLLELLGFKKARLDIAILPESQLRPHGNSGCRFRFAPNAGQELQPLNKIASSGETARVMLALKTVLAEADATPLLVFDEVDANVGGEVGRAVGAELARLAGRHQVLSVTHLPQVASLAHSHFVVTKDQEDNATRVAIRPVHQDRAARLEEIARMLGDRHSVSARAHAGELLAGVPERA